MTKRPTPPRGSRIEEALDYCLANPDGLSAQQLLDEFPEHRERLQPLLRVAYGISHAPSSTVPVERKAAMKQRLMDAAAEAAQRNTGRADPEAESSGRRAAFRLLPSAFRSPKRVAWAGAVAAAVLIMLVWWASASSLPDSPFYDVKLTSENLILNLATDPGDRALAHASLAKARIEDVRAMAAVGKLGQAGKALDSFNYHVDSSIDALKQATVAGDSQVATQLLVQSMEGNQAFATLNNTPGVPALVKNNLARAVADAGKLKQAASRALSAAGVDPSSIPTPQVSPVALTTPTIAGAAQASAGEGGPLQAPRSETRAGTPTHARPGAVSATETMAAIAQGTGNEQATDGAQPRPPRATGAPIIPTAPAVPTFAPTPASAVAAAATLTTPVKPIPPATSTTIATFTAVATNAPESTATAPRAAATHTPAITPQIPTRTPVPAEATTISTPVSVRSTATVTPTLPASTDTQTPTQAPTQAATQVPTQTATQAPTQAPTRIPATSPTPEGTSTPQSATRTPTVLPVPTGSVCDLQVAQVDISCAQEGCGDWSAVVHNTGGGQAVVGWTVELLISLRGSSNYQTVASDHSISQFAPGDTTVQGTICFNFPPDADRMKVRFRLDNTGYSCDPQATSPVRTPCLQPTATPRPQETNTPHPAQTTEPTHAPERKMDT
jgi:hypothetical protein